MQKGTNDMKAIVNGKIILKDRIVDEKEIGENIPVEVANDGDVTALAGAMDLNDNSVLGIAMGTSEAGGYRP